MTFYHCTLFSNMDSIASSGLQPRKGQGLWNHSGYGEHSQGKTFLASTLDGAFSWFTKIGDLATSQSDAIEDQVVVMLKIHGVNNAVSDPLGEADVKGSFFTETPIPPNDIEYWDPEVKKWVPVAEWGPDISHGISRTDVEDDVEIHWPFDSFEKGGFKPNREDRY